MTETVFPGMSPLIGQCYEEEAMNVRGSKGRGEVGGARRRKVKGEMI